MDARVPVAISLCRGHDDSALASTELSMAALGADDLEDSLLKGPDNLRARDDR
jgi:hypothetical protein